MVASPGVHAHVLVPSVFEHPTAHARFGRNPGFVRRQRRHTPHLVEEPGEPLRVLLLLVRDIASTAHGTIAAPAVAAHGAHDQQARPRAAAPPRRGSIGGQHSGVGFTVDCGSGLPGEEIFGNDEKSGTGGADLILGGAQKGGDVGPLREARHLSLKKAAAERMKTFMEKKRKVWLSGE